jgi:hypothetical protein
MRFFWIVSLIVVSACTQSSQTEFNGLVPPKGVSERWVYPRSNSQYFYKNISLDTGSGILVPTMTFDTLNYLSKGAVDGKSNVESFLRLSGFQQMRYIAIEDNDDISGGEEFNNQIFWTRYPTSVDTLAVHLRIDSSDYTRFLEFLGTETLAVPAGKYFTYKVRDSLIEGRFTYSLTYWYAPAIGCYARWTQFINNSGNSPTGISTATSTLIEYRP